MNYDLKHDLKVSKSGEDRIEKLWQQSRNDEITGLERERGWAEILAEQNEPLTIAKALLGGMGNFTKQVGMEYAELAIAENPDSFEAHHVWTLCNFEYYEETDPEKAIAGFRQLVERFPNSSIAHYELSWRLPVPPPGYPIELGTVQQKRYAEEALASIQRAIQLDDRISPNNATLAQCYVVLGAYEKALAVYQGMEEVNYGHTGGLVFDIHVVQDKVSQLRQQDSE